MKGLITLVMISLLVPGLSFAESNGETKEQLMDEFIRAVDAGKTKKHYLTKYANRYINHIKEINPEVDPKAEQVIRDEISKYLDEELMHQGSLNTKLYPIVSEYFTKEELIEIVKFYRSEVGKKTIEVIPVYQYQSEVIARRWSGQLAAELRKRIEQRIKAENIQVVKSK